MLEYGLSAISKKLLSSFPLSKSKVLEVPAHETFRSAGHPLTHFINTSSSLPDTGLMHQLQNDRSLHL